MQSPNDSAGSIGIACAKCGHQMSRVIDKRLASDGSAIRRRRECVRCGERSTTNERRDATPSLASIAGSTERLTQTMQAAQTELDKLRAALNQALKYQAAQQ